MANRPPISLHSPIGGVVRRYGVQTAPPYASIDILNCLTADHTVGEDGRDICATRPGLTSTGINLGAPYGWTECTFRNAGATYLGLAVAHATGVRILYMSSGTLTSFGGADFLTTDPGTDFCSVAVYAQKLYFARFSDTLLFIDLTGSAGLGATITPSAGTVPTNCGIVCTHLDRIFAAGDESNPHTVYACRVTDPTNWDYAATDDAAAWASSGAEGGKIRSQVTCLASHSKDCLLIGQVNGLVVLRGNPITGEQEVVSHHVGPLSQNSWCHDSAGNFWFLGPDAMYRVPAGCADSISSISREALPDEMIAVDPAVAGTYSSVSFDARFRCIWVYIDQTGTSNDVFWCYELTNGSWTRHTFSGGPLRLGASFMPAMTTSKAAHLAISDDGEVFQHNAASTESFDSHIYYGPIQLGSAGAEGILHAVQATCAAASDDVSWKCFVAGSAQEAYALGVADTPSFTGANWTVAGLSTWQNPMRRGSFAYIKCYATGTARWALDNIDVQLRQLGLRRVG